MPEGVLAAAIVSATVGQVGHNVVTSRDVEISSIIEHWYLLSKKTEKGSRPSANKEWLVDPKSEAFRKQLNTIMAELLIVAEAENFSVAQISPVEIHKESELMSEDLKSWPEWTALEVSPLELEQHVGRHLRAKEFLKFKTESMGMQISDDEAKKYYDQNKVRFNNLPFENFRQSIKEFLISRDVEAKMKDWFDILRKKYKVKILQFESEK